MLFSWCVVGWAVAAQEPPSPTHIVQNLMQAIRSIKTSENGTLSAPAMAQNTAATKLANSILDIPNVSQRILGRHWKQRTPTEQREFTALLTELFTSVAYPKSAEFFGDLDVKVQDERITGQRAVVATTVSDPKEGLISVDYQLQQHENMWRVRDIILDEVSLTRNLRSQCQKIITEHSYDELLRRMRDKLNE
jgi:phospholipid transport system substrate-binding protein